MTKFNRCFYYYNYKNEISDIRILEIEQYYRSFEELVRTMFCDSSWQLKYGKRKKLRVLCYILYYGGITVKQLLSTNITPASELDSERVFLGRLVSSGDLEVVSTDIASETVNIYVLTKSGINSCCNELLELSNKSSFPLSEECIKFMKRRAARFDTILKTPHFLSVRDLSAYFLSQFPQTSFSYRLEVMVKHNGEVFTLSDTLSAERRYKNRDWKKEVAFLCDALLSFSYDDGSNGRLFIEQDMCTQHLHILSEKINRYIFSLASKTEHPEHDTVLFALQTKITEGVLQKTRTDKNRPSRTQDLTYTIPLVGFMAFGEGWEKVPAQDLVNVYSELKENVVRISKKLNNTLEYIRSVLIQRKDLTIGQLCDLSFQSEKQYRGYIKDKLEERHKMCYIQRRKTLYNAVNSVPEAKEMFLYGFSVCTAHNRQLDFALPNLLSSMNPEISDKFRLAGNYYFGTPFDESPAYEPFVGDRTQCGFGFRNHYSWSNDTHLLVENISDDFGGMSRVAEYMKTLQWPLFNGYLLCLVDSDNYESFWELYKDSNYKMAYMDGDLSSLPLRIACVTYDNVKKARGYVEPSSSELIMNTLVPFGYQGL